MPPDSCCGISFAPRHAVQRRNLVSTTVRISRLGRRVCSRRRERHVREDVAVRQQRPVLEQHAHAPAQRTARCGSAGDVPAVDDDFSLVGVTWPVISLSRVVLCPCRSDP
jgi:hypothetical protein